jgi:tyrosyl-tRNA synthetase
MEITLKNIKAEIELIGTKTLVEYIKTSRTGMDVALNRKQRVYIYNNREDLLSHACYNERVQKVGNALSANGMAAYDAITKHRDEVMLVTA